MKKIERIIIYFMGITLLAAFNAISSPMPNQPPTISSIADQISNENVINLTPFAVNDAETPLYSLSIDAVSSNETLVRNQNITIQGIGKYRSLVLQPEPSQTGTTDITLKVQDAQGAFVEETFTLTLEADPHHDTNLLMLNAFVQQDPPQVTLTWPRIAPAPTIRNLYRRTKGSLSWGTSIPLPAGATSYTDSSISLGTTYEYKVELSGSVNPESFILVGTDLPVTEYRGKIILIVDATFAEDLMAELLRLEQDLIGDGWEVIRHDIARDDSVVNVKALIQADYQDDPVNVKAVFLFGHVPVPYSGTQVAPDGHTTDLVAGNHLGAWAADVYYGDVDGSWTDNDSVSNSSSILRRLPNRNFPGDGKFDQGTLPSDVELQVGRVDLFQMTDFFPKSEKDLLKQYLDKNHQYRHNEFLAKRRGIALDKWAVDNNVLAVPPSDYSTLFGSGNVFYREWFPETLNNSYLWGWAGGPGYDSGVYPWVNTAKFANEKPKVVFNQLFGSYFGDWHTGNNFLRAPLASSGYGLTSSWGDRPSWHVYPMALGATIGDVTKISQNSTEYGMSMDRGIWIALMGDPTLRLHTVDPPSNLVVEYFQSAVHLTWKESEDTVEGYYVYRKDSSSENFIRLNEELLREPEFYDDLPVSGLSVYMVKAVKQEFTPSGNYYNSSQGVSQMVTVDASGDSIPPQLTVDYPLNGQLVYESVDIEAQAMDTSGIARIELWVDGNLLKTTSEQPYRLRWDTAGYELGDYPVSVKAIDLSGNVTSRDITLTVSDQDEEAPLVEIIAPVDLDQVFGQVKVDVSASDNDQIDHIDLLVDGQIYKTITTKPYQFGWDAYNDQIGTHTLSAVAYDRYGNQTEASVNVTVDPQVTKPTIHMITPQQVIGAPGAPISFKMRWEGGPTDIAYDASVRYVSLADGSIAAGDWYSLPIPTTQWSGELVYDYSFKLPDTLPVGNYKIMAHLFTGPTSQDLIPGEGVTKDPSGSYQIGTLNVYPRTQNSSRIILSYPSSIYAGNAFTLTATVNSLPAGNHTFLSPTPEQLPRGMTLSYTSTSGTLSARLNWMPGIDQIGQHRIPFRFFDGSAFYEKEAVITVQRAVITVTAPNGGGFLWGGQPSDITWTSNGSVGTVKLEYSLDGGTTYPYQITPSVNGALGRFTWAVPHIDNTQVRIKITSLQDPMITDVSNSNFEIRKIVNLTSPVGGESLVAGENYLIRWALRDATNNHQLSIEYSMDGGWTYTSIATVASNALSYQWTVPIGLVGTQARIRIKSTTNSNITDVSPGNFSIKTGSVTIVSPNGSESWSAGSTQNITWTTTGNPGLVKLEYSTDSGATYPHSIVASVDSSLGTYSWVVPDDAAGSQTRVKITGLTDSTINDTSNADFEIQGARTLISPNGGEKLIVGKPYDISWTGGVSGELIKIEYSTDEGTNYSNVIAESVDAGIGHYTWTVPNAIGTKLRVRIMSVDNPAFFDNSNANFSITIGTIAITSPVLNATWYTESAPNITWTPDGAIGPVDIILIYANGWSTYIAYDVDASLGNYSWVAHPIFDYPQGYVKIVSKVDGSCSAQSELIFLKQNPLRLTSPASGAQLFVGNTQVIGWGYFSGAGATVKLEYSTDGGLTYPKMIASSISTSQRSYAWVVPDDVTSQARIKITDNSDPNIHAVSFSNFSIVRGIINLTSPNGSESLLIGSTHNITWTKTGTVGPVNIYYSTDNGTTYPNLVASGVDSSLGSYAWTVPDSASKNVRVKIVAADDPLIQDSSDNKLNIIGQITLLSPNGGEEWLMNAAHDITWTTTGTLGLVNIYYSTDSGTSYPTLIATVDAGLGNYHWNISSMNGSVTSRIIIRSVDNTSVFDKSDGDFKLNNTIILSSPNGGESLASGTVKNITWTTTGSVEPVKIEYSRDGGVTYPHTIVDSVDSTLGSYAWTVPDLGGTVSTVRVRITSLGDTSQYDSSDSNFSIKRGVITITSPNGGEKILGGTPYNITWNASGTVGPVKITYRKAGSGLEFVVTFSTDGSTGNYTWNIGSTDMSGVRLTITSIDDPSITDSSDAEFQVVSGIVTITSPNGGEIFYPGETRNITWMTQGTVGTIRIEYSTDGGATYPNMIASSVNSALGSYSWTVPSSISSQVRIKVSKFDNALIYDTSDADLTIQNGSITITSPNGGEVFTNGETRNITWTTQGYVGNVKLEYSSNGGASYAFIASVNAALGSYSWTVSGTASSQSRIKVSKVSDATVNDISDSDFTVKKGSIAITYPNGGETLDSGTIRNITWTKLGSIGNVKLEYSSDGGVTYPNVIAASVNSSSGTYAWIVPDKVGTQFRVKITDSTDTSIFDNSNADFGIADKRAPAGSITINSNAAVTGSTAVTLALSATDAASGMTVGAQMQFSNDGTTWSTPEAYATTKAWTLTSGEGTKTVYVKFKDAAGNWSNSFTDTISLDTTLPVISNGLPAGTLSYGTTTATLSVQTNENATCKYATGAGQAYNAMTDTFTTTGVMTHSRGLTGLKNGIVYNYYVKCQDTAGNTNPLDHHIIFSVRKTTTDLQAPTAPSNLVATVLSTTQIKLTWNASTDNSAVAYWIYRDNTFAGTVSSITTFTDGSLTPNTTCKYKVIAYDASKNLSPFSTEVSATTQSVTPPVSTKFKTNDLVRMISPDDIQLYSQPGETGTFYQWIGTGELGFITSAAPVNVNGTIWWQVNFDNVSGYNTGWVEEQYLTLD